MQKKGVQNFKLIPIVPQSLLFQSKFCRKCSLLTIYLLPDCTGIQQYLGSSVGSGLNPRLVGVPFSPKAQEHPCLRQHPHRYQAGEALCCSATVTTGERGFTRTGQRVIDMEMV